MKVLVRLSNGNLIFGKEHDLPFIPDEIVFSHEPYFVTGHVVKTEIDLPQSTSEVFCSTEVDDAILENFAQTDGWESNN